MSQPKKGFFYIPTWILILICIGCAAGFIFDIYLLNNLGNFDTIAVNGEEVSKDSEQYNSAIKMMKYSFMSSAVVTLLISVLSGWFARKRVKSK